MSLPNGNCTFNKGGSLIAPYITSCYKSSTFCDLVLIPCGNVAIMCHKLVLCSLSQRLLSICSGTGDTEDSTYVLLPQFTHQEVRSVVDMIYGVLDQSKVEIPSDEVTTVLGINNSPLRHKDGLDRLDGEITICDQDSNRKRHRRDNHLSGKRRKAEGDDEKSVKHRKAIELVKEHGKDYRSAAEAIVCEVFGPESVCETAKELEEREEVCEKYRKRLHRVYQDRKNRKIAAVMDQPFARSSDFSMPCVDAKDISDSCPTLSELNSETEYMDVECDIGIVKSENDLSEYWQEEDGMDSAGSNVEEDAFVEKGTSSQSRRQLKKQPLPAKNSKHLRKSIIAQETSVKSKKPIKQKSKPKPPGSHPPYINMVSSALVALREPNGSSRRKILKYIMANFDLGNDQKRVSIKLKLALRSGSKKGVLKQRGHSSNGAFKLVVPNMGSEVEPPCFIKQENVDSVEMSDDSDQGKEVPHWDKTKWEKIDGDFEPDTDTDNKEEADSSVDESELDGISSEMQDVIKCNIIMQETPSKRPYHKTGKFRGVMKNDPPPGTSAEELLAEEKDPDILALQKEFVARESLWIPNNDHNEISSELHKLMSESKSKRILVKRAGTHFNIAPVRSNVRWIEMQMSEKPSFATILGVKNMQENSLDPSLIKFNGELIAGRPLAWSLPKCADDVNAQYDAVMAAFNQLLGFSEEQLHCTTIFRRAHFGHIKSHHRYGNPKEEARKKISKQLRAKSKEEVCNELMKMVVKREERNKDKTNFELHYDRCRLQFDHNLQSESFEGLMLIAWYGDGQSLGKILNFDEDPSIFLSLLRDVWSDVRTAGSYKLPFTEHMYSCFVSVYERTFASQILPQLMDGSAPSKICSTCGKLFYMLSEYDRIMYLAHVRTHEFETPLDCGCEEADKIDSALGRERHKKLFHSDGKFVQCSIPKCSDILPKAALDNHVKEFHMVNLFCEQCGISFCDKKLYQRHYKMNHVEVECKVCKVKFPSRPPLTAHMRTHKGEPHPCHECGKEFPDKFILRTHIRMVHTPKEELPFQCPYPDCQNGYIDTTTLLIHLNNVHFKMYVYSCQYGCPGANYKDQSNLRAHLKKKHDLKYKSRTLRLADCFKLMTEEERVYHESILHNSLFYKKLQKTHKLQN